jgi:hypothetical protein
LSFHIDQFGYLSEHNDYETDRAATDIELQMWHSLCPELPMPCWPRPEIPTLGVTPKELSDCLIGDVPYTLNALDVAALRQLPGFEPEIRKEPLQMGTIGRLGKAAIYVSRAIPKGYYYQGAIELWLTPEESAVEPDLDPQVKAEVQRGLRPLMEG